MPSDSAPHWAAVTGSHKRPPFGEAVRAAIVRRPDMLTAAQFAERFGLARSTVDHRHENNKLLALHVDGGHRVRYPAWQGKWVIDPLARQSFERVLKALSNGDEWSAFRFFTEPNVLLAGQTPIEAWSERTAHELVRAAESWAAVDPSSRQTRRTDRHESAPSLTRKIHSTEALICPRAKARVRFTVTRVSTAGAAPAPDPNLTYKPDCTGWSACGAFEMGFPQEVSAVAAGTPTGCPWFDERR